LGFKNVAFFGRWDRAVVGAAMSEKSWETHCKTSQASFLNAREQREWSKMIGGETVTWEFVKNSVTLVRFYLVSSSEGDSQSIENGTLADLFEAVYICYRSIWRDGDPLTDWPVTIWNFSAIYRFPHQIIEASMNQTV
jgi:hypothetical protein